MRELEVIKHRRHQSLLGERGSNAGSVTSNPPASPLLRHISCCSAAASYVQNQIAGISGHQQTALNDLSACFDDIGFLRCKTSNNCVLPKTRYRLVWKVVCVTNVIKTALCGLNAIGLQ